MAQDHHSSGCQPGGDLLAHKVVEGGVGGNLGVLPRALTHHIDGCNRQPMALRFPPKHELPGGQDCSQGPP